MNKIYIHNFSLNSPVGNSVDSFYDSINNNNTFFSESPDHIKSKLELKKAGYIKGSSFENLLSSELSNYKQYYQSKNCGLVIATTIGSINKNTPYSTQKIIKNLLKEIKWTGPVNIMSDACISGISAINWASGMIKNNHMEDCIIITVEEISEFILSGFNSLRILGKKGFYPAEGSAAILISKRPSNIEMSRAEVFNDAKHITAPNQSAEGLIKCIKTSIEKAGLTTNNIDMICPHATQTDQNDKMEKVAIENVFKNNCPPIKELKKHTGHAFSVSALWEIIYCIKYAKEKSLENILSFNNAFGGNNAAILLKMKYKNNNVEN